ncbi:MAG: hypothetical protein RL077_1077 [Verrucomicrobiota bacterium]|jgi:hypothetical protein
MQCNLMNNGSMIASKALRHACYKLSKWIGKDYRVLSSQIKEILSASHTFSIKETHFLYFYAAVCSAWDGKSRQSRSLLKVISANRLAEELSGYLARSHFPAPYLELFDTATPLKTWGRVAFNKRFNKNCLIHLDGRNFPNQLAGTVPHVLDIGTGDGDFLVSVLRSLAAKGVFSEVGVVLVEKSSALLLTAEKRLRKLNMPRVVNIISFAKHVEDLDRTERARIGELTLSFAMSAATVHHLGVQGKRRLFRWIGSLGCDLLVFELEGNEESRSNRSVEFLFSVFTLYSALLHELYTSSLSLVEKQRCARHFIFAEALQLLSRPYLERQNYHALTPAWTEHAQYGGFSSLTSHGFEIGNSGLRQMILDCRR